MHIGEASSEVAAADEVHDAHGPNRPFMGCEGDFVEIYGLRHTLRPEARDLQGGSRFTFPVMPGRDFNGACGRILQRLELGMDSVYFLIHTLDDVFVRIPSENLRAWEPHASEDGGFDVMWPSAP